MAPMTYTPTPGKPGSQPPAALELSEEDRSKDIFFVRLGELAEEMVARHGKDFTMGTMLLSARFIAEDKPLIHREKPD